MKSDGGVRNLQQHSDTDWVKAVCLGDRSAYTQLARKHYQTIFLVCLGVLGNVHDAEDVAQETLIAGFERIAQLRHPDQFRNWMVKIARNRSVNFLRGKAAGRQALRQSPQALLPEPDQKEDLRQAIAQLPWDLRLPLVMYYFDGRSVKSVAQALEISTSGVYLKLRTAICELHDILTKQGDT